MRRVLLSVLAVVGAAAVVMADDWPGYLGPRRDGTSAEKGLLAAWPEGGPKVLWTRDVGKGYGGASVRDGKVYFLDREGQARDVLRCLNLGTGKEEWTFGYDAPGQADHDGSRSVPTVGEKYVFTVGLFGHFHCIDKATHEVVWKKHLLDDYGTRGPRWAVAQSPLLYKASVIVAPQSDKVGVEAFDQATGKSLWTSETVGPMDYASPVLLTIGGVDQVIVLNRRGPTAVDANTGKVLWHYPHPCKIPVASVLPIGDGKIFVTGGYNAGSAIIEVTRQGDAFAVKELARVDGMGGHCHPGLAYQGHVYVLCNTNERADGLVCFSPEGKVLWQTKRDPYLCKGGSVLTGDGLIYLVDGREGDLYVIQPSPEGFKPLGKAKVLGGKEIWGPLALADGRLVIRDQSQMKCVDVRGR